MHPSGPGTRTVTRGRTTALLDSTVPPMTAGPADGAAPLRARLLEALAAWQHPELDADGLASPAGARVQHKRAAAVLAEVVAADPAALGLPAGTTASWLVAATAPDEDGTSLEHHLVRIRPGDGSAPLLVDPAARRHSPDGPASLVHVEDDQAGPPAPWVELRVVDGDLAAYLRAQRLAGAWTDRARRPARRGGRGRR